MFTSNNQQAADFVSSLLVVEDDDYDFKLVAREFERQPRSFKLARAVTLREASKLYESGNYDAIILDLHLVNGSGLDFLNIVRAKSTETPVLILTGQGSESDAVTAIKNGASEYLIKGLDTFRKLPSLVSSMLVENERDSLHLQTLAELQEWRKRFMDFAEATSDWLWETDKENRFIFVSVGVVESLGLSPSDLIGSTFAQLGGVRYKGDWELLQTRLEGRRRFRDLHIEVVLRDGGVHTLSMSAKPHFSHTGEFLGYRGTASNISEKIQSERKLREALAASQSASAAKSKFLAVMSHELRTPLNAIIGFSDIMLTGVWDGMAERQKECMEDIRRAGGQLLKMVGEILDLSRIEAGKFEITPETFAVEEAIEASVHMVRSAAASRDLDITVHGGGDDTTIFADRSAFDHVVGNVLSNAVKFSPENGAIDISVDARDDGVRITISDHGIGIAQEDLGELMEPFHRLGDVYTSVHDGAGLGLSIVQGIMDAHGGTVDIDSEIDVGTAVRLFFPKKE